MFLDFRKELKVLIDNIAILVSAFVKAIHIFFGNGNDHGCYNLCKVLPGVSSHTFVYVR